MLITENLESILRYAVSVKHSPDLEDIVQKKNVQYFINDCWMHTELIIF